MRILLLLPALLALSTAIYSQNISDALRLSQMNYGGTARSLGAGGAFSALGADFGTASQNPAGMAMFRSDEMMFTPTVRFTSTDAAQVGNQPENDQASRFLFGNLGLVFNTNHEEENSTWKSVNFGIGFNQVANYRQSVYYQGESGGTILNPWFADANATGNPDNFDAFSTGMAYNANAIYSDANGNLSYDFINDPAATVNRSQLLNTYGQTNEMTFAFAGNYKERVMLGATVGVPFTNYRLEGDYNESDPGGGLNGNVQYFDNLNYTEYLRTSGVGINLKMGAIVRVTQAFRVGGAFHTPTFFNLTDRYSNTFNYVYEDGNGVTATPDESPEGTFSYKLRTPARAMFGGSLLVKKLGFISADVEWVDYGSSRFNLTSDVADAGNKAFERELNGDLQRAYQSTLNYRVGAELVLDDFRFRGGYNLNGKAKAGDTGFNTAWTAGIGMRLTRFYMDLGLRHRDDTGILSPYSGAATVNTSRKVNDILLTVGFKF